MILRNNTGFVSVAYCIGIRLKINDDEGVRAGNVVFVTKVIDVRGHQTGNWLGKPVRPIKLQPIFFC